MPTYTSRLSTPARQSQAGQIIGTVLIWSAVTCHRFGPWRLAAAFRRRGLFGTLAATCRSDQSDDRSSHSKLRHYQIIRYKFCSLLMSVSGQRRDDARSLVFRVIVADVGKPNKSLYIEQGPKPRQVISLFARVYSLRGTPQQEGRRSQSASSATLSISAQSKNFHCRPHEQAINP